MSTFSLPESRSILPILVRHVHHLHIIVHISKRKPVPHRLHTPPSSPRAFLPYRTNQSCIISCAASKTFLLSFLPVKRDLNSQFLYALRTFVNQSYGQPASRISTGFCMVQCEVNRRIPLPYLLSGLCSVRCS